MDITYWIMIPVLLFIHQYIPSYGMSIIALTLCVRVVVWPFVAASTKNMKRMQLVSPKMKAIQERYKDDPEMQAKKIGEFYSLNKMNPFSSCLPMVIQLPLLFALFATFNGPPFGDKPVDVKVNVIEAQEAARNPTSIKGADSSGNNSPYVSPDGKLGKVIVYPGDATVAEGQSIDFNTRCVDGVIPSDFKVKWGLKEGNHFAAKDRAFIEQNGHATFYKKGEYHVEGVVDGIYKDKPFGFITSLGKKPCGMELLKPENWDQVFLILIFGISMYFSSKLSMGSTKPEDMDENQRIQQDSMKYLPLIMTVSFFMMPLPTGVYVYMNVSNLVQTFQTWLLMKLPVEPVLDPDDVGGGSPSPSGPASQSGIPKASGKNDNGAGKTIDIGPAPKNGKADAGGKIKFNEADPVGEGVEKRKPIKKKKKK